VAKTVYRLIAIGLVLGTLLFAGLYIAERFRLSDALNDSKELRTLNRELSASNRIIGDQLDEARATVDRIERDKRALDIQLGNVGSELANSKRESAILRKQLIDAQAAVRDLTSGSVETGRIVEEFRLENRQFRSILEKYELPANALEMGGNNSGNSGDR